MSRLRVDLFGAGGGGNLAPGGVACNRAPIGGLQPLPRFAPSLVMRVLRDQEGA